MTCNQQFEMNREGGDRTSIMELLAKISYTSDSIELQGHINEYLKKSLEVPHVFMVPLLPESNEGLIQVINARVLEKEIRFSVSRRVKELVILCCHQIELWIENRCVLAFDHRRRFLKLKTKCVKSMNKIEVNRREMLPTANK